MGRFVKYIRASARKCVSQAYWEFRTFLKRMLGKKYGWSGRYSDWSKALSRTKGYDSQVILEKVRESQRKVISGEACFERDSVLFLEPEWNWHLLICLFGISGVCDGFLRVLDFGGALGSAYFQNRRLFGGLREVDWNVVEQAAFVECGRAEFESDELHFWKSIKECLVERSPDVLLLSSVLPYLESPYELLDEVMEWGPKYIIIDRTGFVRGRRDRLTIQKVNPAIYESSYPCWFFSRKKVEEYVAPVYDVCLRFDSDEWINIDASYGGFLLRRRDLRGALNILSSV
jgi:putative methyltransferase (TIGR04325 family)